MKNFLFSLIFFGLLVSGPISSYGQNYSGQWLGTVTESVNYCKQLGKAEVGDYKLTIIHDEDEITVMENVIQRPYTGVVNPDRPKKVHVQGNYVDDGGYVSELLDIEFEEDTKGKGQGSWRWSDGYYQCGGRYVFTLEKMRE